MNKLALLYEVAALFPDDLALQAILAEVIEINKREIDRGIS